MGDGYNELVAKHSGKCLDAAASSTADAANVQQWSCHGGNNQRWKGLSPSTEPTVLKDGPASWSSRSASVRWNRML